MTDLAPSAFYTWLDVELSFDQLRSAGTLPDWITSLTFYYFEGVIAVVPGTPADTVNNFLALTFGPRFIKGSGLALESVPEKTRFYVFEIEEASETSGLSASQVPLFRKVASFPEESNLLLPSHAPLPEGGPELVCFYSFKGGVGRTTHLLAYLQALTSRGLRALVVDADLEAPGISYLLNHERDFRPAQLSFLDLLSLAQADQSENFAETIELASFQVRRQSLDLVAGTRTIDHYFLPAHRSATQAMRLDIRPEHLVQRPNRRWAITELLTGLGQNLAVDAVVIDLRAGLSELAAPLLFDQRIRRVIVTTPSRQAVDGSAMVLRQLRKFPDNSDSHNQPFVVISFVLPDLIGSDSFQDVVDTLTLAIASDADRMQDQDEASINSSLVMSWTLFTQELLYISSLKDAFSKLSGTSLAKAMATLSEVDIQELTNAPPLVRERLGQVREALYDLAYASEYAESGKGETLLRFTPLRSLARQFSSELPIAVVLGSKGSGKTYTSLQVARAGTWEGFVSRVSEESASISALIWPFLVSKNLQSAAEIIVRDVRKATSEQLGSPNSGSNTRIVDSIRRSLQQPEADETWWRNRWFSLISESLGIQGFTEADASEGLLSELDKRGKHVVVTIDGLEDLFSELASRSEQRIALRALIQDLPAFLREVPKCPLGLLIFVRADLAQIAIQQNYGQFAKLYESFALRWSETDALRLALWFATKAGVPIALPNTTQIELATADQARDQLILLWGRKLGSERSREARAAEWVIAALSDANGQVQARDLVRLLRHAAAGSKDSPFSDRVLTPRAIRDSIGPCSSEKIDEIKQEIPQLAAIFTKLQENEDLRIPFDASEAGLTLDDVKFLQRVGILVEDRGLYVIPEIFRLGLGFRLAEGARPRVLGLGRRNQ